MPYATAEDLLSVLSQREISALTSDTSTDGATGAADDRVAEALSRASSRIDSYLAGRYSVPLTTVPEVVEEACLTIAKRNLLFRRSILDKTTEDAYRDAVTWLKDVARGDASVPGLDYQVAEIAESSATGFASGSLFGRQIHGR